MTRATAGAVRLASGVWWGYCPKIGEPALIIDARHQVGAWKLSVSVAFQVRQLTLTAHEKVHGYQGVKTPTLWFQLVEDGKWQWGHGLVDTTGTVTQWG